MNSPLYPRTRARKQHNIAIQEEEISLMSMPRMIGNRSPIDVDREVETCSPRQQEVNDNS